MLESSFLKTWISQITLYNGIMEGKKKYKNEIKIYKYIVISKL